jgi:SNF2 family DNA or RNA helicase
LLKMENTVKAGILADDMGLGKTIQALALIMANKATSGVKTTLIVAPVALIRQWEREITLKVKEQNQLSVLIYHRSAEKKLPTTFEALTKYDVVITTYQTIFRQFKVFEKGSGTTSESGTPTSSGVEENRPKIMPFFKGRWYRIILDEAQYIKNKNALTSKACSALEGTYRWCLSGTPMQNSIDELYSLLRFLRIQPYCEEQKFRYISSGLKSRSPNALRQVQAILKAVLLRRTKSSTIDGKPILTLPPKNIELRQQVFDGEEESYYRGLETGAAFQMNKYLSADSVSKNYSNILTLLLRLRQACCHPALIERSEQRKADEAQKERTSGSGIKYARQLQRRVVERILSGEGITCPICMDAVDKSEMVLLYSCGHGLCRECSFDFFQNTDEGSVNCPTCRGPVDSKKTIDYTVFTMVHVFGMSDAEIVDQMKAQTRSAREEARLRRQVLQRRRVEKQDAAMFADDFEDWRVVQEDEKMDLDWISLDENINTFEDMNGVLIKEDPNESLKLDSKDDLEVNAKEDSEIDTSNDLKVPAETVDEEDYNTIVEEFGLERLFPNGWVSSTKITKCVELVENIRQDFPGEKVLIFSQFTTLLDLVEIPLVKKDLDYLRYDGSLTANDRNEVVFKFFDKPEVSILLISLKAGNVGLTLTCASHVIILDPFWNPFVEEQAMDRAHRIGQSRPVFVHRLLVKNTVEDRIMALQHKKKELISAALDETGMKSLGRLNQNELLYLFGLRPDGSRRANNDDINELE